MKMQEVAGLLVDRFLKGLLGDGVGWHVTNSPCGNIILRKRVNKSFANFRRICELSGGRRSP